MFPALLMLKVRLQVHTSPQMGSALSQLNPVSILLPCSLKFYLNLFLPSTLSFAELCLLLWFLDQPQSVCVVPVDTTCRTNLTFSTDSSSSAAAAARKPFQDCYALMGVCLSIFLVLYLRCFSRSECVRTLHWE